MVEHTLFEASADWLQAAVEGQRAEGRRVVAPRQSEGAVELAAVEAAEQVATDYLNVRVPLKSLFLPRTEVLLEFEQGDRDVELETPPAPQQQTLVLGSRPCDAAALEALDTVFHWDYEDLPYHGRRERATVVSFACREPDENCFCTSVGGSPRGEAGSDALVLPDGEDGAARIRVLSEKGRAFVDALGEAARPAEDEPAAEAPTVEPAFDPEAVKSRLEGSFESDLWDEVALRCLGCGACSFLCPTCHCFDIVDEATWNRGRRRRNWDCCAFGEFTRHASGHNPRPGRAARFRQRVMHKFNYFPERFDRIACVGCGRCLRNCAAGQDLIDILRRIEAM